MKSKATIISALFFLFPLLMNDGAEAALGYYNLLGYEGIGTLGSALIDHGQAPPVGDYVTTHCRYINVPNTTFGQYYLRYPLHLPNGVGITNIAFFVADFNPAGGLAVFLRSRPWNSRGAITERSTITDNTVGDKTVNLTWPTPLIINNQTTEYWIEVSPENGAEPGQLCVYGIQVTYSSTLDLPIIQKGD